MRCYIHLSNIYHIASSPKHFRNITQIKKVLLYTSTWGNKYWYMPKQVLEKVYCLIVVVLHPYSQQRKHFPLQIKCPVTNCDFVSLDDNPFGNDTSVYDALLFHMPNVIDRPNIPERRPGQRYLLYYN